MRLLPSSACVAAALLGACPTAGAGRAEADAQADELGILEVCLHQRRAGLLGGHGGLASRSSGRHEAQLHQHNGSGGSDGPAGRAGAGEALAALEAHGAEGAHGAPLVADQATEQEAAESRAPRQGPEVDRGHESWPLAEQVAADRPPRAERVSAVRAAMLASSFGSVSLLDPIAHHAVERRRAAEGAAATSRGEAAGARQGHVRPQALTGLDIALLLIALGAIIALCSLALYQECLYRRALKG